MGCLVLHQNWIIHQEADAVKVTHTVKMIRILRQVFGQTSSALLLGARNCTSYKCLNQNPGIIVCGAFSSLLHTSSSSSMWLSLLVFFLWMLFIRIKKVTLTTPVTSMAMNTYKTASWYHLVSFQHILQFSNKYIAHLLVVKLEWRSIRNMRNLKVVWNLAQVKV